MCNKLRPLHNTGLCSAIPVCSAGTEGWVDRTNSDALSRFQHQSTHSMTFSLLQWSASNYPVLHVCSAGAEGWGDRTSRDALTYMLVTG